MTIKRTRTHQPPRNRRERRAEASVLRQKKRIALDYAQPLPMFLDSDQFAELCHTSRRSVERWRRQGSGPPFLKRTGRILYDREVALAWLRSRVLSSTSDPRAA
jgi:hypothetical protein